ncbi:MAG: aspartate/glutamate racemase family protein [Nitrososphaeria archaeon]
MVKILYLVPGLMDKAEQSRRQQIINGFVSEDSRVEVMAVKEGPISIESAVEEDFAAASTLKTIVQVQNHYDAIIIGCAGDPGLRAARELARIPVIGPMEASIAFSFTIGDRFGVIVPLDRDIPTIRALMAKYEFHHRLASIQSVNIPVLGLQENVSQVINRLKDACNKASSQGADVIVLGCMSLAFILADDLVAGQVKVPVLNPAKISVKVAEMSTKLGLCQSRSSYPLADYAKLAKSVFKEELANGIS